MRRRHRQPGAQRSQRARAGPDRKHHRLRSHAPALDVEGGLGPAGGAQPAHARVLEQPRAARDQPCAQAEPEPRRLHAGGVVEHDALAEGGRVAAAAQLLGADLAHLLGAADLARCGRDRPPRGVGAGRGRGEHVRRVAIPGVDALGLAELADLAHRVRGGVGDRDRVGVAQQLAQPRQRHPERLAEAAVAAARPVAADVGLEQRDLRPGLGREQVPGGPHARVSAPDDRDVHVEIALQRRHRLHRAGLLEPPSVRCVAHGPSIWTRLLSGRRAAARACPRAPRRALPRRWRRRARPTRAARRRSGSRRRAGSCA